MMRDVFWLAGLIVDEKRGEPKVKVISHCGECAAVIAAPLGGRAFAVIVGARAGTSGKDGAEFVSIPELRKTWQDSVSKRR